MKALLIIAHGSRRKEANQEILNLECYIKEYNKHFDLIQCGFMEFALPDIEESIRQLINFGAKTIVVLPYFLAKGWHVEHDIPQILSKIQDKNPTLKIFQLPHIGSVEGMKRLVLKLIQAHSFPMSL